MPLTIKITHCKPCNKIVTLFDQFVIGKELGDMDLGLCCECVIQSLKDILAFEVEKERWQQQRERMTRLAKDRTKHDRERFKVAPEE